MIPFFNPTQGHIFTSWYLWHFAASIYLGTASWWKLTTYCFHAKVLVPYLSVKEPSLQSDLLPGGL